MVTVLILDQQSNVKYIDINRNYRKKVVSNEKVTLTFSKKTKPINLIIN